MPVFSFQLLFTKEQQPVFLRELNGNDELMTDDTGSITAISLLNKIMCRPAGYAALELKAEELAIADRDYLLSGVYKYTYGSKIQSTINCQQCNNHFDLDFLLDDFVSHIRKPVTLQKDGDVFFTSGDGWRFRLPTGNDEMAIWGLPPREAGEIMLSRCLHAAPVNEDKERVQEIMEEMAPMLKMDMEANCPECGHSQKLHFDMQSFLLTRMKNERQRIAAEIHSIASAYQWTHQEISNLPRSLRKTYAMLVGFE